MTWIGESFGTTSANTGRLVTFTGNTVSCTATRRVPFVLTAFSGRWTRWGRIRYHLTQAWKQARR